jgi:lysophospholipase L1-like esterase
LTACGVLGRPAVQARNRAGASVDASPSVSLVPRDLLLLGDSIMVGARDIGGVQRLLEGSGWVPEIIAEIGQGVPWALQQVEDRFVVPRIVLVELGSNPGPGLGDFPNEVPRLIQALVARGAQRIVWIPPVARDPTRYAERDDVIARAASSTVSVSQWPAQLEQNPQWFGDELHLTEAGYQALALFIRDELAPLHG